MNSIYWVCSLYLFLFASSEYIGIGESDDDQTKTLKDITEMALNYGNIQEVILQPYSPGEKDKYGENTNSVTALKSWLVALLIYFKIFKKICFLFYFYINFIIFITYYNFQHHPYNHAYNRN